MSAPAVPGGTAPAPGRVGGLALWLNLGIVYTVWGSTYFGIAIAIETMPPFLMAAIRFAIAGSILLVWDLARHPEARHLPTWRQVRDSLIVGGLLLGVANGLVAYGQQTVASGIAAILVAMMPLWFALFGRIYFGDRLPRIVVVAVIVGFVGTALLIWPGGEGANSFELVGIVILTLAPIAWAHGSMYSQRKASLPPSPLTASGMQMLAGSLVCAIEGIATGEPARFHPEQISFASLAAFVYLIIFGSMVAYTAYGWLLRHAPLSIIGTYAYVNPVVAVALGTLFLGEPITPRTIFASGIIIVAVAIIVSARARLSGAAHGEVDIGDPPRPDARSGASNLSPAAPPRSPSG